MNRLYRGYGGQGKRSDDEPGLNYAARRDVLYNLAGENRKKMKGIIGKKIGMTSVFDPSGKQTACTIIEAGPWVKKQIQLVTG